MVRVGIVEDDEQYIGQLQAFLTEYTRRKGESFHTRVYRNGQQLVFDYQPDFDILLMDIEMPKMNGMEAAKKVREIDPAVQILFITNMAQYAIEGYKVQAKAYLLKPLNFVGFSMEMESAIEALSRRGRSEILVSSEDGTVKIPAGRITYIETDGHDLLYHTVGGQTYRTRSSMKEADQALADISFARASVSYLVNLVYVSHLTQDTVTVDGTVLPLSRAKRKGFLAALTEYVGTR
ncbi:MAG: response regulator transcription factor [Lachnospiraceae bacterium]|nr:response regulator transcription factor [Lachnospiraceae bacterium]